MKLHYLIVVFIGANMLISIIDSNMMTIETRNEKLCQMDQSSAKSRRSNENLGHILVIGLFCCLACKCISWRDNEPHW